VDTAVPHTGQNFAPSGSSFPHFGQYPMTVSSLCNSV
jgi:hypothetical protein